jgi:cytochrome c biogenesis protein CcdA/thiol-disulfide isomerase/thioredoxin
VLVVLLFAFVAGILTILGPCTLPVVPLALGIGAAGGRQRAVGVVLGFCLTFVAVTVALGAVLAAAGLGSGLRIASAIVLGIAGLAIAVPRVEAMADRALAPISRAGGTLVRPVGSKSSGGLLTGLVLGSAIGLVWAPCVGPIMAAVIAVAATRGPTPETFSIATSYVAGAAIPVALLLVAGRRAVRPGAGTARSARPVRRVFGVAMVVTAIALTTGLDLSVGTAVADTLPAGWSAALTGIEQGPGVQEELDVLRSNPPGARVGGAASGDTGTNGVTGLPLPPAIGTALPGSVALEDLGAAPDFRGIQAWIDSDPLTIASLRGKVVLVEFWTFSCINCIHVQPYVKAWYDRYASSGLVVVGVHTPELAFERELGNVRDAVAKAGLAYPVAVDPDFATWNAYRNLYWPAFYFIDRSGQIRHTHFGEGDYDGSEQVIRQLLASSG